MLRVQHEQENYILRVIFQNVTLLFGGGTQVSKLRWLIWSPISANWGCCVLAFKFNFSSIIAEPSLQQIVLWINRFDLVEIILSLRPEVFHSVKFWDETQVGSPCFAFVVLEKPKSPPANQKTSYYRQTARVPSLVTLLINNSFQWKRCTKIHKTIVPDIEMRHKPARLCCDKKKTEINRALFLLVL